jgi:hypothetical protein
MVGNLNITIHKNSTIGNAAENEGQTGEKFEWHEFQGRGGRDEVLAPISFAFLAPLRYKFR